MFGWRIETHAQFHGPSYKCGGRRITKKCEANRGDKQSKRKHGGAYIVKPENYEQAEATCASGPESPIKRP